MVHAGWSGKLYLERAIPNTHFFFFSRIDRSPILLISRTQPQTPMQRRWAQSPLAPQVDSSLKPSCTRSSGADPPCCRNYEPRQLFQASRKKPVIWVNGLLVYQNSNFVLLLSSNHLKHISPLKREKLERSKETALPLWTVENEQTQGYSHSSWLPGQKALADKALLGSIKREVLRRRVLGEGPRAFILRTHSAYLCIWLSPPTPGTGPKHCQGAGPLSCTFCLSVSVLDLVPATLPSFLGLPRSLSSSNPAWAHGYLPLAVSSGAYPHPGLFWGRRVTEKDQ